MHTGTGRNDPRRRLVALAVLLILSLGLGGALAFQAINTARRHRLTAERALQDYADFGAFILGSRAYRQLGSEVVAAFTTTDRWLASTRRLPAGVACAGQPTWFERAAGATEVHSAGHALPAATFAFLADTLRNAMPLLGETGWRFRWIRMRAPTPSRACSSRRTWKGPTVIRCAASPRASTPRSRRSSR